MLKGSRGILSYLKRKKYKLAVASNRPTAFSRIIIKQLRLGNYLSYLLCADKLRKGKPHPEILRRIMRRFGALPEETVFVGDMPIDAQAAKRAGVRSVIVSTGSGALKEIRREKPYLALRDIAGLKAFL